MSDLLLLAPAKGATLRQVIFIHGLQGDPRATWTSPPPANALWPTWLAEDIEGVAVWSVGYDAPVTNWNGSAMELSDRGENIFKRLLTESQLRDGELIFVGHSLGGLVIKQLLRKAESEAHDAANVANFVERVRKVGFLATPHFGADLAGWGDRLRALVHPSSASRTLIRNDQHLRDLNLWYRGFARRREIDNLILVETKNTSMLGMIVKPDSSDPGLLVNPTPVDADHVSIAKPASRSSEVYQFVRNFIVRKVKPPPDIPGEVRKSILIGIGVVLLAVATFGAWEHQKRIEEMANLAAIVQTTLASAQIPLASSAKAAVADTVEATAAEAKANARAAKALQYLKDGNVVEATALFAEEAREKETASREQKAAARKSDQEAATAYRHLGAIAGLSNPQKARDAYAKAAMLDPESPDGLYWDGWYQFTAGNLDAAEKSWRAVLAMEGLTPKENLKICLFCARNGLADIARTRGDLKGALELYQQARDSVERRLAADPADEDWQRNLEVSADHIGDVLDAQGNLPEALQSYQKGLAIAERLLKAKPADTQLQFDLAISKERIGDVLFKQGDLAGALKFYQARHSIISQLVGSDVDNIDWQRDLSVSFEHIGRVLTKLGNLPGALQFYKSALTIAERLAQLDPGNASRQRDLSMSKNNIGNVLLTQGNLDEALKTYRSGLAIRERLAQSDPGNAVWQHDLSVSMSHVGDVLDKQGDLVEALEAYRSGLVIAERLAQSDTSNAQLQRDLSVSMSHVGEVLAKKGDLVEALKAYRSGLVIAERLEQSDTSNAQLQRDILVFFDRIGDVLVRQGDLVEALKTFRSGLVIAERLALLGADDAERKRDLAGYYSDFGRVFSKRNKRLDAVAWYKKALTIMEGLAMSDPTNMEWKSDVMKYNYKLAKEGDDPTGRFALVGKELRAIKLTQNLETEQSEWLSDAEAQLSALNASPAAGSARAVARKRQR